MDHVRDPYLEVDIGALRSFDPLAESSLKMVSRSPDGGREAESRFYVNPGWSLHFVHGSDMMFAVAELARNLLPARDVFETIEDIRFRATVSTELLLKARLGEAIPRHRGEPRPSMTMTLGSQSGERVTVEGWPTRSPIQRMSNPSRLAEEIVGRNPTFSREGGWFGFPLRSVSPSSRDRRQPDFARRAHVALDLVQTACQFLGRETCLFPESAWARTVTAFRVPSLQDLTSGPWLALQPRLADVRDAPRSLQMPLSFRFISRPPRAAIVGEGHYVRACVKS